MTTIVTPQAPLKQYTPPASNRMEKDRRDYRRKCQAARDEARTASQIEFTGTVERIKFQDTSTGYAAFTFYDKSNKKTFTCMGTVGNITTDVQYRIKGTWKIHPTYGKQFKIHELAEDTEISSGGLAAYIGASKEIYGIGPAKAEKLVSLYGDNLKAECAANPEGVATSIGVKVRTVEQLLTILTQDAVMRETKFWLADIGFTINQIAKLTNEYGWNTQRILKENPYQIIKSIKGFGFRKTDDLAKKIGVAEDHPERVRAGILYVVGEEIDKGHTWIEFSKLLRESNKTLAMNRLDAVEFIKAKIQGMIDDCSIIKETLPGRKDILFRADIFKCENTIVETFRERADDPNPHADSFDEISLSDYPELNDGQCAAVALALQNKLFVLSGGAGVGKTYTLRTIADIYDKCKKRIAFCALAGKAARRITEQTGRPASTIHRLLEYSPRDKRFQRNALNPLSSNVVIVDETSMIDVELFHSLLQAIDFKKTALILVGDHQQLPSIGPGSILRDLVATRILPTIVLTQVMRQAGRLKENSLAILSGAVAGTPAKSESENFDWYRFDSAHIPNAANAINVRAALLNALETSIQAKLGFSILTDVQVLTPTRQPGRALSAHALNVEIQRLVQKQVYGVDVPIPTNCDEKKAPRLLRGDRVIQTKNDYDLGDGVFNGTIGFVKEVDPRRGLLIDFDDGQQVWVQGETRNSIELAYAVTVHKAQGSEFPCVVTVCHRSDQFMLHRNWLYTAVTRARKCSILIGDNIGIARAAGKTDADKRRTWLALAGYVEKKEG